MESRQEYPSLLASLSPDQAVNVLNDRVNVIKQINSNIADWLQERRRIEEAYVQGLRKLASRPQADGGAALGIFQTPWQRIVSGTENLAASHEILAHKIENDVEGPLRRFNSSNREMQAVTSSQGNLLSIAKGLESAQKKAAKGGRRAEDATTSVDEASRSWESQAPYVFEQLQALDERRVSHLRDVLTQFQTHEVDQVERTRASAESCINALLNIETADEIKTFAAKASNPREAMKRRRSSVAGTTRPSTSSTQVPPAPPPPRLSQREQSISSYPSQDRLAAPDQTPTKSKLGGLKRLGTVINRRKSAMPPPPPPPSEKKEKKSRPFSASRRGDSSRSFQDLETTGADVAPSISEDARNDLTQVQSTITETQSDFTPPARSPRPAVADPNTSMVNGTSQPLQPVPAPGPTQHMSNFSQPRADPMAVLQPTTPRAEPQPQPQQPQQPQPQQPPLPPPPQEMPAQTSPIQTQAQFPPSEADDANRNFAIRDKPIQQDESEAQAAMNNMASQLRMQAQSSGMNRVQGSVRGRRDVRNTMFIPSGVDTTSALGGAAVGAIGGAATGVAASSLVQTPSTTSELASPISKPLPRAIPEEHILGSDTTSIHSSHSLTNQPHHPELHDPGLNASIIETVNSWFTESGISKSFVTGEIALAYNPGTSGSTTDVESIRLTRFELLEKVAANPVFVTAPPKLTSPSTSTTEETAGTFNLSLTPIRRPTPMIGLKYQLHIDADSLATYSPLLLTPAWQIIEGQASVIVLYSLNPAFSPTEVSTPVTLKNVIISISLDPSSSSPPPTSAMFSPPQSATFRRKAASVVWRFPELSISTTQERLLARFITASGIPKKGSIEVKFELPGRSGSSIGVERRVGPDARAGAAKSVDPFADEGEGRVSEEAVGRSGSGRGSWEEVSTRRTLVTGRYTAS